MTSAKEVTERALRELGRDAPAPAALAALNRLLEQWSAPAAVEPA